MTAAPTFTILAPVHRPPDLLPFALFSVRDQTRQDFEVFIICDGAPEATAKLAQLQTRDPRFRAFIHPKGERHGEAWRHLALQEAQGRIVCQIGDDDLWFGDHLAEVEALMETADFGATLPMYLHPDGGPRLHFSDFGDPVVQRQMAEGRGNAFGPTPSAYRLETYRALPQGWSPAPPDSFTDLHMWRKFLALPGIRCATRFVTTSLTFPQALRRDWSVDRRREEIAGIARQMGDPGLRDRLFHDALAATARQRAANAIQLHDVRAVARKLLTAVNDAEKALQAIVETGSTDPARAALEALPDAGWRAGLRGPSADG